MIDALYGRPTETQIRGIYTGTMVDPSPSVYTYIFGLW